MQEEGLERQKGRVLRQHRSGGTMAAGATIHGWIRGLAYLFCLPSRDRHGTSSHMAVQSITLGQGARPQQRACSRGFGSLGAGASTSVLVSGIDAKGMDASHQCFEGGPYQVVQGSCKWNVRGYTGVHGRSIAAVPMVEGSQSSRMGGVFKFWRMGTWSMDATGHYQDQFKQCPGRSCTPYVRPWQGRQGQFEYTRTISR